MTTIGAHPFLKPVRRAPGIEASPIPVASTAPQGGPARQALLPAAAGVGLLVAGIYFGAPLLIALISAVPVLAVIFAVGGATAWLLCRMSAEQPIYVRDDEIRVVTSLFEVRLKR